jgi:hypothetical protein
MRTTKARLSSPLLITTEMLAIDDTLVGLHAANKEGKPLHQPDEQRNICLSCATTIGGGAGRPPSCASMWRMREEE